MDDTGKIKVVFHLLRKSHLDAQDDWDAQWYDHQLSVQFERSLSFSTGRNRTIPLNEVESLLVDFMELVEGKKTRIQFEPMEPDFRMTVTAISDSEQKKTHEVEIWVDRDNLDSVGYGLSYIGAKFICTSQKISEFVRQLSSEIVQVKAK